MGVVPFVLGIISIWNRRKSPWVWGLVAFSLFFVCLSFGKYLPLHEVLHSHVAAYSKLRYPEKFILYAMVIWLFFALLQWSKLDSTDKKNSSWLWLTVGTIHLLLALVSVFLLPSYGELIANWEVLGSAAQTASLQLVKDRVIHLGLGGGALAVYGWLRTARFSMPALVKKSLLPLFVLMEMLLFAPAQNVVEANRLESSDRLTKVMDSEQGSRYRVLRDGNLERFGSRSFRETWTHNWGLLNGARYAFGYETIVPSRTERLIGAETFRNLPVWARILNLRYVLSTLNPREKNLKTYFDNNFVQPVGFAEDLNLVVLKIQREDSPISFVSHGFRAQNGEEAFQLVKERGDLATPVILEFGHSPNESSTERLLVTDLKSEVAKPVSFSLQSKTYRSNQWKWRGESDGDGFFVIRENYHPLWRALLDGNPVSLLRADYTNSAVFWPAGNHELVLTFAPPDGVGLGRYRAFLPY